MRLTNPTEWVYVIIIGMLLCGKISVSNLGSSCSSSISNMIFQTYGIKNVANKIWVCPMKKKKKPNKTAEKRSVQMCAFHKRAAREKNKLNNQNWQQGNRKVFRIPTYTNWSKLLCAGLCPWVEVNRILQDSTEVTPVILKKCHLYNVYIPNPKFME